MLLNLKKLKRHSKVPRQPVEDAPDLIEFPPDEPTENPYAAIPYDLNAGAVSGFQDNPQGSMTDVAADTRSSRGSTPTTSRQNSNTSQVVTPPVKTLQRKVPLIPTKSTLPSHSQLTMVKRALTGVDDSTTYHRAMYQEKRAVETLEKYILAKQEVADAWQAHMETESNMAIRDLYRFTCELDRLWVQQQNKHRDEVKETRKLFKLLALGEQNLQQLQKAANAASNKVTKIQKQMDEALAKGKSNKGNLDLRKLEQIQRELEKAVETDRDVQTNFQSQTSNNQIFKYNSIRKMLANLGDAEILLYRDCWRIAEVKSQLVRIHMGRAYSKVSSESIRNANAETNKLMIELYSDLGMTRPADSEMDRPPQPQQVFPRVPHSGPNLNRPPAPLPVDQTNQHRPLRAVPSAPDADVISMRGSVRSHSSNESDPMEMDACYTPIPDMADLESPSEAGSSHREDDIYEFDDDEFDDVNEIYENCYSDVGLTSEGQQRAYLDLVDDTAQSIRQTSTPARPPRSQTQSSIVEDTIYEDTDDPQEPTFPPPPLSGGSQDQMEDIFGNLSSLQLKRKSEPVTRPTPSPRSRTPATHTSASNQARNQSTSIWPSLSGLDQQTAPDARGSYGHVWEAQSGFGISDDSSASSSRSNSMTPPTSTLGSTGSGSSQRGSGSGSGSGQRGSGSGSSGRVGVPTRGGRTSGEQEPRYVSGPGSQDSGQPARPQSTEPKFSLESEFRQKLQIFQQNQQRSREEQQRMTNVASDDIPPPLPNKRTSRPLPQPP